MDEKPDLWVIVNDEVSERKFFAAIGGRTPLPPMVRLQRVAPRPPPSGLVESELRRYGLQPGEAGGNLAVEVLEAIGDGAVRIICVTHGLVSDALRSFCANREVALLSADESDFADQVREARRSS